MGTTRLACAAGVLLTLGAMGCAPSLGECDPVKAKQVVFLDQGPNNPANGLPMYAGQALMQLSCGNGGFCHSAAANGDARYGAPAGLDFDVSVACPVGGACEGDAITRLARNQHRVFKDREDILRVLDNRTMPPGKVGREVRARAGNYVSLTIQPGYIGGVDGGQKLPEIRSADGRDIVRNWLACGAPVVERVETPDDPRETGKDCTGDMSVVGDCRLRAPTLVMPEPNWDSIYDTVIEPLCVSCHGPDDSTSLAQSKLDLSDRDAALPTGAELLASTAGRARS